MRVADVYLLASDWSPPGLLAAAGALPPPWWLLPLAYGLDLAVGDPSWLLHPVVVIGRAIAGLEARLRRPDASPGALRLAGALLVLLVVAGTWTATAALLWLAGRLHPWLGLLLQVWLFSTTLAARGLGEAGQAVLRPLRAGNLAGARLALSQYVGRDTAALPEPEVVRAAVETVAENSSDAVVAPLFYGLLGGAPLALAYKAVNTLDSMLGYKSERYLYFGWAAARLDDLVNWLPARLTGLLLVLLSPLVGGSCRHAWRSLRRDARQHPSPNSGFPEAAVAGALGVRLGGLNHYQGVPSRRPHIGESHAPLRRGHIDAAIRLMHMAGLLALVLGCAGSALLR